MQVREILGVPDNLRAIEGAHEQNPLPPGNASRIWQFLNHQPGVYLTKEIAEKLGFQPGLVNSEVAGLIRRGYLSREVVSKNGHLIRYRFQAHATPLAPHQRSVLMVKRRHGSATLKRAVLANPEMGTFALAKQLRVDPSQVSRAKTALRREGKLPTKPEVKEQPQEQPQNNEHLFLGKMEELWQEYRDYLASKANFDDFLAWLKTRGK